MEHTRVLKEEHGRAEMTAQGLMLPAIVVIVGQACSLRCKNCCNFSPYAPNTAKVYPLEEIKKNLTVLFQAAYVRKVQIQGGEPFLYQRLPELLDFIGNSGKAGKITVATNGTIVPSEAVLLAMQRNRVRVRISDYPVIAEETLSRLIEVLESYDLEVWSYEFTSGNAKWLDMGRIDMPPLALNENEMQAHFLQCPFYDCFTLENGYISRCSRAVMAEQVQGFTAAKRRPASCESQQGICFTVVEIFQRTGLYGSLPVLQGWQRSFHRTWHTIINLQGICGFV